MEKQLFSWESWDSLDTWTSVFSNVVLKEKIGDFEVGTNFKYAIVSFEEGFLHLQDMDDNEFKFKLKLVVVGENNNESSL